MAEHQLTCRTCGAQFLHHRRKAYCSTRCRPSVIPKGTDQHAGAACRREHQCLNCGVTFKPKRAGRTKFCGRGCGLEWTGLQATLRRTGGRVLVRKLMTPRPAVAHDHPPKPSWCCHCGAGYYRSVKYQRYCSDACSGEAKWQAVERYKTSPEYRAMRRRNKKKRRAIERGARVADSIDPIKVFERDGWRCGICGCKTHKGKRGSYHPRAPELDHIIALANGGTHTWRNVQCSCRECNGRKGASDYGQLLLFPAA